MTGLAYSIRYQCHILWIPGDLMPFRMHDKTRPGGITQLMQFDGMWVDKIQLACHMQRRDRYRALQVLVIDDLLRNATILALDTEWG